MTPSEVSQFKADSKIKHFALYNYAELKIGNPEYLEALKVMTGKNIQELSDLIAQAHTEVELVDSLAEI